MFMSIIKLHTQMPDATQLDLFFSVRSGKHNWKNPPELNAYD